jgi:hypothetical protein
MTGALGTWGQQGRRGSRWRQRTRRALLASFGALATPCLGTRAFASGDTPHAESSSPRAAKHTDGDYRALSALGLASAYAGFGFWTWFAWYRERPRLSHWSLGGDGGFGIDTYAGGADKLGHAWSGSNAGASKSPQQVGSGRE